MKAKEVNSWKDYQQYVEEMADCCENELEGDDIQDTYHYLDMQVDSDRMIMYYSNNMKVLQYSNNEPSEWKHLVSESDYWKDVIQAMAYDVMRMDLYEELRDRGLYF